MYNTEYENGVLICSIHRTPISKSHGRFFCLKCQRDEDTTPVMLKSITEHPDVQRLIKQMVILQAERDDLLVACKFAKAQIKKGAQKKALPILRAVIAKCTT